MNYSAVLGLCAAMSIVIMGMLLGGPLIIFFDPTSVLFLGGGTALLILAAHGPSGWSDICAGLKRMLLPAQTVQSEWGADRCQRVAQVARSAGNTAIMMAACGAMIGLTQMLAHLEDPTKIGPAMAVCLLCTFYAAITNLFVFVPMTRYFREAELAAG